MKRARVAACGALCLSLAATVIGVERRGVAHASALHANRQVIVLFLDGGHPELYNERTAPFITSLARGGVSFTAAQTGVPSDSMPGIVDTFTGADPTHTGIPYDVFYDRRYHQTISLNETYGAGVSDPNAPGAPGTVAPQKPFAWQYVNMPVVFKAARDRGLRTVFYAKHKAYSTTEGPTGNGLTSFVWHDIDNGDQGEIGSGAAQPSLPPGFSCGSQDYRCQQHYDDAMFAALTDTVTHGQPVAIGGLYVLAPNAAQKISPQYAAAHHLDVGGQLPGGYASPAVTDAIGHVDAQVRGLVDALEASGRWSTTTLILTADHGQTAISPNPCAVSSAAASSTCTFVDPSAIDAYLQARGVPVVHHTSDDVDLIYLADPSQAQQAYAALSTPAARSQFAIDFVLDHAGLAAVGAAPPQRTPDVLVQPLVGYDYDSFDSTKLGEHGGFHDLDRAIPLIVAGGDASIGHPGTVITRPVLVDQFAPTAARILGFSFPSAQFEPLPGVGGNP